jgi:2-amino-4-hydroxy-6-hydroxymethyldihydropteridine diphosphokinase
LTSKIIPTGCNVLVTDDCLGIEPLPDRFRYLVAIGSNLGDRRETIGNALQKLQQVGVEINFASSLLETAPVGVATETFLNGAIVCTSHLAPELFLLELQSIEKALGRNRLKRWDNRTIDLDLLMAWDPLGNFVAVKSDSLQLPHPWMLRRPFVMEPVREILRLPEQQTTLYQKIGPHIQARRNLFFALVLCALVRYVFATFIPFGNDEAYYWDWGRHLQMSYFDHPPIVSWMARVGQLLGFTSSTLAGRFVVPVVHFVATWTLLRITEISMGRFLFAKEQKLFLLLTQLMPVFSLGGLMLMPDVGLIVFSMLAIWHLLLIENQLTLNIRDGALQGILWGCAGLSKYHAAVMAFGVFLCLLVLRRRSLLKDAGFYLALILLGLAVASPVFYWNYTHDYISFKYQGSKGLNTAIQPLLAARTVLLELVFLGPLFVFTLYRWLKLCFDQRFKFNGIKPGGLNSYRKDLLLLAASLPLIGLLKIFSFTTQTLPHWSMPGMILLIPFIMAELARRPASKSVLRWHVGYGLCFVLVLPLTLILATPLILSLVQEKPGALGEMTLWPTVAQHFKYDEDLKVLGHQEKMNGACSQAEPVFAAGRWYESAQWAANLPNHPRVYNLDPNRFSYYAQRDNLHDLVGCRVIVLTERDHFDAIQETYNFDGTTIRMKMIYGHRDRPLAMLEGIYLGRKN